ncbi:histidine kinase [Streptomyces sp. HUAS TT20]|uniref:histidine kinase n=1 Tax=Streptomyces sp. HUAS TT20 TaxID=3447509 RepID=UPI0021D7F574|nr:histidine kinase [Streptomyces sp. HUAS 15-9]UXY31666.1 histidine kinase [Streptomyces sp. HUAS 15-9]
METIRNWLLPTVLAAVQMTWLWPGLGPAEPPGTLGVIGVVCALSVETVALGRRRRTPVRALTWALGALVLGQVAWPDGCVSVGTLIAVYSVAVRCPVPVTRRAVAAALGVEWLMAVVQLGFRASLLGEMAIATVVYVLCAGLGEARRQWLAGRLTAARRLAGAENARRLAGDHERHRLARELHDVSAHHLTSVVVTVDAARRLGDSRPDLTAEALSFAERTGTETLTALQRLVGLLRDTDHLGPRPMSGQIEELVAGFGRLGRPVTTQLPDDLAGPAAEAIHGIVREALTNVLRYAPGAAARVTVRRESGLLELTVDNAPPRASAAHDTGGLGAGRGVAGMRERAAAVGGELTAGPRSDGGWRVRATLPDDTGPRHPPGQEWRRDILREQRLADPALAFTATIVPVVLVLADTEDWPVHIRRAEAPGLLLVALLLALHALPLLWRRRAPWAAFLTVLATAWLWPVAAVAVPLSSRVSQFFTGGTLTETLALYAVAAYGRGAARTWPAVGATALGVAGTLTATASADGSMMDERASWPNAVLMVVVLCVVLAPVLASVWASGLLVRRRRVRVLAHDDFALANSMWHAYRAAEAERHRLALKLRDAVLDRTASVVDLARQGGLEEVAAAARSALAAMRELLHNLGGESEEPGSRLAPSPTAADLDMLCHTLRAAGRDVRLRGLSDAARGLPPSVSVSVYRNVETALGAGDRGPARVTLRRRRDTVHITVSGVRLAVAGPVAERLSVQADTGEGRITFEPTGTVRVSLPVGPAPAPVQEVSPSPYA